MILIINGCCGVGKTTIAENLAQQLTKSIHIRADDVHNFIVNSEIVPEQIAITDDNILDLVKNFKRYSYEYIIIDNVYETKEHVNRVRDSLKQYDEYIVIIHLQCNINENIRRDKMRASEDIMGEQRIRELNAVFKPQIDEIGIVIDTTGLSIEKTLEIIKDKIGL